MTEREDRSNVIVLGMHRSGTSLLAGTIAKLGWWVSDDGAKMKPQHDNPMGFWERQDIVELNDEILLRHEQSWHSVLVESAQLETDNNHCFSKRVSTIIEELDQHRPFVVKDPRLCLTWPYWEGHFSNAKIVVINRHPMEVALSLQARNGLPIGLGLGLWLRYIQGIAGITKNQSVYHVEHRAFIENSENISQEIYRYLVKGSSEKKIGEEMPYESIVNKKLVHHSGESDNFDMHYSKLAEIWEKVKTGDYTHLPRNLDFLNNSIYEELYQHWAKAYTLSISVQTQESQKQDYQAEICAYQKRQEAYRAEIDTYQKQLGLRDLQQQGIAESLIAYQSSKMYRATRLIAKVRAIFTKGLQPDAIDKITETLVEQNHIETQEVSPSPVGEAAALVLRNPVQFAKQVNLSRVKTAFRMLVDPAARANLSIALTRYRSVVGGGKLMLFTPGSVKFDDIQLDYNSKPKVSIIIPVFNEIDSTLACIKSIVSGATDIEYEIIVADDCSTDETCNLSDKIENIRLVRTKVNQGFLGNCNHAAQYARGEYLVFLNNDTNVQKNWLVELIVPLQTDETVGLVGSQLVYPDGRLQEAGGVVFNDGSGWNYGKLGDRHAPEYNFVREVDYISGASIAIRKAIWNQLGGFDPLFKPAYYEDTDLCFQVRQLGYKVIYTPFSVAVHYEGVSHGTDEKTGIKKYQLANKEKFAKKWATQLKRSHYDDSKALFRARIHGKDRPVLLIIDHYVPMHDKDAGSRSTRKYIELLVSEGIHIIFLGDNFYPHQPYTEQLQRLGVEILHGDLYKNSWENWFSENKQSIDCVYIHRPHIAERYLSKIKAITADTRIVYFGHDLHYLRVEREAKLANDNALNAEVDQWKQKELKIMRTADLSLFPAEYEAEKVKALDSSIRVDHIPLYWFDEEEISAKDNKHRIQANLLFVGGFGHPPNIDGLNWFMDTIWPIIVSKAPETHLTIIGSKCPESVKKLAEDHVHILGEVSDTLLDKAYAEASIAIVPLRYGAGIKGKVLEAMSKGVAVCTTPIGAEGLPQTEIPYMMVAEKPGNFASNVLTLLGNVEENTNLKNAVSEVLKQHFSRQSASSLIGFLGLEKARENYGR